MTETALLNLGAWSIQAAVVALAAAALWSLIHIDAPAIRYVWWRAVLIGCLALPVLQPWQPGGALSIQTPAVESPAPAAAAHVTDAGPLAPPPTVPASPRRWGTLVTTILAGGMLLRLAWLAAGVIRLRRIRGHGAPVDGPEADEDLLRALRDAGAEVRSVPALHQPVTFGVWKPAVLLPGRLKTMPPGVQRAVLAHELWHVRRRDWLWTLAEELLRAACWFNPAIWYLVSRVQSAREEVVDELAILSTNARRTYLEALLAFADQPAAYPAAPFIRRRQLFNRMMLITREGVMSSKRIVASCAGMAGALVLTGWYAGAAFPLTAEAAMVPPRLYSQQPRDPRPGTARPATLREAELSSATTADPSNAKNWLELAKLQEDRGAVAEAERTLRSARSANPASREIARGLAGFFNRQGQFENTMAVLEDLAAQDPSDPSGHQLVATYYWEKAQKDQTITPADKLHYIDSGIRAADRALAQKPDYVEALTYKNILLRMKGNLQANAAARAALFAEADALRNRAMELARARGTSGISSRGTPDGAPPPPPPPPPPSRHYEVDGQKAVRVGGGIKPPAKVHHVDAVYPPVAQNARVSGLIIMEVLIDPQGHVRSTHVLRSIPLLDQAAVDAVKQWRFTPTEVDGVAVPLIMTVTVNFTPQ